ncbi:type I restriction enzyme S subunit [Rhodobacter viridis]|uniref:Type I restriction enzyme S subunit n=1 Tax=Rhodobacter viridis TaxID=1054202 RepID=A0A318TZL6_9RHOB|nr:restriction endonuclease subunit S [Rhodobacter viridis]PYF10729.1 type I restriction enzyme S subunit [Rhodobacter viridis]
MTELPNSWEKAKFADFGTWIGGGTPSKANSDFWNGDIPWISPKDMKSKIIRAAIDGITEDAIDNSAAKLVPAGSVLMVIRSGILAHTLPIAITAMDSALNQDLKALTLPDGISSEFIAWGMRAFEQSILVSCRKGGTTVHSIEMPSLAAFELPIAPTNEQRRIVARIEAMFDEIDHGVENLKKAKATLGLYRQSLLKAAFEGRLTADWRARNGIATGNRAQIYLNDCIEFLTSGSRGWADYYADQGDIFIRAQNLKHDRLKLEDIAYVKLPAGNSEGMRTRVKRGDILITITGANVTKTALVENDLGVAYVSQHVALCRLSGELNPRYVWHFLLSKSGGRKQLEEAAYGAGKPGLNLTNIREVRIPICAPEEQAEIARLLDARLSAAEALEAEIDASLARAEALRQSILKQAFSGKLVAQDPMDEPAATLLARIKTARRQKTSPRKISA